MKKILKKLEIIYKNSETFVDFLYKIVFSIISIFILVNANKLSKEQVKLNEELTSPTFIISEESYLNGKVKIENTGGKVSHLFVERIDEIYVRYRCQNILISINVYNGNISSKNKIWYFVPNSKKYDVYDLYHEIDSSIKNKDGVEYVLIPSTYYKITYMDYNNSYHQDYYELYGDESKYISSKELDDRKFIYRYDFFISDDDYLNANYKNIINSLNEYIDYRNNKLRNTTKKEA